MQIFGKALFSPHLWIGKSRKVDCSTIISLKITNIKSSMSSIFMKVSGHVPHNGSTHNFSNPAHCQSIPARFSSLSNMILWVTVPYSRSYLMPAHLMSCHVMLSSLMLSYPILSYPMLCYVILSPFCSMWRPFKMNTAEAIAACLYITGFKDLARVLLDPFG